MTAQQNHTDFKSVSSQVRNILRTQTIVSRQRRLFTYLLNSVASCLRCRWLAYWLPPSRLPFLRVSHHFADCGSRLPSFWLSLIASLLAPLFILISAADVRQTKLQKLPWNVAPRGDRTPSVLASHLNDPWHVVLRYKKVQALSLTAPWRELSRDHPPLYSTWAVEGMVAGKFRSAPRPVVPPFTSTTSAPSVDEARRCLDWRFQQGCRT